MYPPLPPSPKIEPAEPVNGQLIQLILLTLLDQIKDETYTDPRLLHIVDLILEYMD